jgi:two-component system, cell cycle response regulator DivK
MDNVHALIIDDNAGNSGVLAQLLTNEGVSYTAVLNPRQLPNVLERLNRVDVVFLDLEMPGMNGYTVLNQFKADARFANTPVIAYTVHTTEVNTARKHGFDGFLAKPIDADRFPELFARIMRHEAVWSLS